MLDIRLIRDQPALVQERLSSRQPQLAAVVEEIIECDRQRRAAETRLQQIQAERKRLSKEIGAKRARGEETAASEADVRRIGDEMIQLEEDARRAETRQRTLLLNVPNLPHPECPRGTSAADNPVVRTSGEKPRFDFEPRTHLELGAKHRLFDFERA